VKSARAEEKLLAVARTDDSTEMRRQALRLIGERVGRRSVEALVEAADDSSEDVQVQLQAVQAIGRRPAEEAIPLLIKIAKTHKSPLVRRGAIRRLGEFNDERVIAFYQDALH
jgi:HEAT repeat protein